ncbi:MAG: hypothetical protein KC563_01200 [Nitrospira sp.]|nr:hypothetical protein [Nitrospira sp.]MCB9709717.1 hypothetical protein [Nitrospiraceae bacterium]MDR4486120.1 hypothetical protein [Nitrospirales bacterium]MCA9466949.1 hypothetical protein [Nitrospira sp.]MCA9474418.1 hypothetical protein [Nitrospira sp.]
MMSLAQWKETRRVDHVHIHVPCVGQAHPRFRRYQGPDQGWTDLKGFDASVEAVQNAVADSTFHKVTLLSELLQDTRHYLDHVPAAIPPRYTSAVQALHQSVTLDLNHICGGMFEPQRNADLSNLAAHGVGGLPPRLMTVNVYFLIPVGMALGVADAEGINGRINQHIANANQDRAFRDGNLTVERRNKNLILVSQTAQGQSILAPDLPQVPQHLRRTFSTEGSCRDRLITYCNAVQGVPAGSIDVVYLNHYDQADVQGYTLRAGQDYNGYVPARPIVTITMNPPNEGMATYPTTLAHELGHALTGCGEHVPNGESLMAAGNNRNGEDQLTHGQLAWFRNNPFASA